MDAESSNLTICLEKKNCVRINGDPTHWSPLDFHDVLIQETRDKEQTRTLLFSTINLTMIRLSEVQFSFDMNTFYRACCVLEFLNRNTQEYLPLCRQTEWEELQDTLPK